MTGNTTYNVIDTLIELSPERFAKARKTVLSHALRVNADVAPTDGDVSEFMAAEKLSRPAAFTFIHAASFSLATGYRSF